MNDVRLITRYLLKHIERIIDEIDTFEADVFIDEIAKSKRIFTYGAGRSGLVAKAFAMRLMHLGKTVYIIGDIITPAITKEDCLVLISGSGETLSVINTAKVAKQIGSKILSITSYRNSTLAKLSDHVVIIKGRTKLDGETDYFIRQITGEYKSLAPLGTLFELATMIFLDAVIARLMDILKVTEEDMRSRHATIE